MLNFTKWFLDFYPSFAGIGKSTKVLNAWTPTNTNTDIPRFENVSNFSTNAVLNSYYVEDASYLRCRSVKIGYTVASRLVDRINMERLRFFVQGTNLFTSTKYSGTDPEVSGVDTNFGVDIGNYPANRQFLFWFEPWIIINLIFNLFNKRSVMFKNNFKILSLLTIIIAVALGIAACNKSFLDQDTTGLLTPTELQSRKGAQQLLTSSYAAIKGIGWEGGGSNWVYGSIIGGEANKGSDAGDQADINPISNSPICQQTIILTSNGEPYMKASPGPMQPSGSLLHLRKMTLLLKKRTRSWLKQGFYVGTTILKQKKCGITFHTSMRLLIMGKEISALIIQRMHGQGSWRILNSQGPL